jgi:hypothetical protein
MSDEDRRKLLRLRNVLNRLVHKSLRSGVESGGSSAKRGTSVLRGRSKEGRERTRPQQES